MGPPEAIAAVAFFAMLIGVAIPVSAMFKRHMDFKERELELTADKTAEKAAQYAAHVEKLEERMRVLERIATDKGVDVAAQIEKLRDEPVPAKIKERSPAQ
jgi:hypothetical protein